MRVKMPLALLIAALLSVPALAAASWTNSQITFVLVQDGGTPSDTGIVIVQMPTDAAYLPSCHTAATRNRVIIDLSRAPAKAQLALLLANQAAGGNIGIDVNETCLQGVALVRNIYNAY